MHAAFTRTDPKSIDENAIKLIGREWFLLTAGNLEHFNTMTASWGALGELWNKPVFFCFVRPQRYTFEFINQATHFSACFFEQKHRAALALCGDRSGRDTDKMKETGLIPIPLPSGTTGFEQARLIFECRKLYEQDLDPTCFKVPLLCEEIYLHKDYHRLYVGEILSCFKRSDGK